MMSTSSRLFNLKLVSSVRKYCCKVPLAPVRTLERQQDGAVSVDRNTIALLERLSLVQYENEEGLAILEESIRFANKIVDVDTGDVQPLYTVLEDRSLNLRPDRVTQGNCQKDVLKNASVTEEEYFVAPTGNIPLQHITPSEALQRDV